MLRRWHCDETEDRMGRSGLTAAFCYSYFTKGAQWPIFSFTIVAGPARGGRFDYCCMRTQSLGRAYEPSSRHSLAMDVPLISVSNDCKQKELN